MTIFCDKAISQKLERTEARANADFVVSRARIQPESGAEWIEVAGTYAMFDGVESPLTQTFGLGVFEEITEAHLDEIEIFFRKHEAPVFHEVSPLADPSLMTLLSDRGYRPFELTNVMFRELGGDEAREVNLDIVTRVINKGEEEEMWARTAGEGWSTEMPGLEDFMYNFTLIGAQSDGARPFIGELDGKAIATGKLYVYDDVALLAGASTIPSGRRQGAQTALLDARLRRAADEGCRLAIMGALPGSQSQRNAEKNGFRVAYTRTKWQLIV
jgi:GNAT superfamily N-acetyltransferase